MFRCLIIIFLLTFTGISTGNARLSPLVRATPPGYGVGRRQRYPAQLEQNPICKRSTHVGDQQV